MRLVSPIGWFMEARLAAAHMHLSAVLGISSNGSCLPFSQPAMPLPRSLNRHGGHVERQSIVLTPTWELLFSVGDCEGCCCKKHPNDALATHSVLFLKWVCDFGCCAVQSNWLTGLGLLSKGGLVSFAESYWSTMKCMWIVSGFWYLFD